MRIEISAGGIGGISVADFQSDMQTYIANAESVISSFKAIQSSTCNLNGGVGSLQGALDEIDQRVASEAAVQNQARHIQSKAADFVQLAERIDKQVAVDVTQNKDELYRVNPWLKPNASAEDTPWYEDAWNWICDKGEQIADGLKKAWDWTKDTAKKAWDGLVEFYNENKHLCQILIGVAAIAVAVVVTVVTGGAAVPALLAMAKAAITAGLISAAIGGSISAVMTLASGESLEVALENALSSAVDGFCSGFMTGGIFASISQIVSCFSLTTSAGSAYPKQEGGKYSDIKKISDSTTEQVHHIPADSINGISHSDGPSILMETADHKMTASFDNKAGSTAYRLKQKQLIDAGKFREAFDMDVSNIQSLFGNKYNEAIQKASEYIDQLIRTGVIK